MAFIRESFPVGPLQCTCTVLADGVDAIVVDPGGDASRIETLLESHGLKLQQIVVTHAHLDHIAAAHTLKQHTGAPILYNQQDLPLVAIMPEQAAWMGVETPVVPRPDESAEDGMLLRLGAETLQVLHTPGHTQGSICLHVPQQSLLLAGDTLFAGSVGRTDLPGGDGRQLLRSIRDRLMHLPEDSLVIPGHGPATTIGHERATNPFLRFV